MNNGFTKQIKENDLFSGRDSRNKFVADFFKDYIGKKVVNIGGGGKKHLEKYLKDDVEYFEIDIDGTPDFKLNLEKDLPLNFKDNEFDTVVSDVLIKMDENTKQQKMMELQIMNQQGEQLRQHLEQLMEQISSLKQLSEGGI